MIRRVAVLACGILMLPAAGFGDLIEGVMNATGTAQVSLGSIAFVNNELTINAPSSVQVGGFMALAGTTASIDNITNPPDATGILATPVTDFMVFSADPDISVTFTELFAGIDGAAGCAANPPAAGQVCTPNVPAESPFNLQNTSATSSSASFQIEGFEIDSATDDTIPIIGTFTTPFTNMNFQQILTAVENGQTITTSFAAQFATIAQIPEPGTTGLVLLTGIPAALIIQRKRKRR